MRGCVLVCTDWRVLCYCSQVDPNLEQNTVKPASPVNNWIRRKIEDVGGRLGKRLADKMQLRESTREKIRDGFSGAASAGALATDAAALAGRATDKLNAYSTFAGNVMSRAGSTVANAGSLVAAAGRTTANLAHALGMNHIEQRLRQGVQAGTQERRKKDERKELFSLFLRSGRAQSGAGPEAAGARRPAARPGQPGGLTALFGAVLSLSKNSLKATSLTTTIANGANSAGALLNSAGGAATAALGARDNDRPNWLQRVGSKLEVSCAKENRSL